MKKLFKVAAISILLIPMTMLAYSQQGEPKTAEERATQLTQWMKTNLQLTDEQTAKVSDINLKYAKKVDELKTSTAGKKHKMSQLKDDDAAKDAELKTVLNDNQFQIYQTKKKELKKKIKEKKKEKKDS